MNDLRINNLLRWSVENSDVSRTGNAPAQRKTELDPGALDSLLDATHTLLKTPTQLMNDCITIIESETETKEEKSKAFKKLEFHLSQIDNSLNFKESSWTLLVKLLDHEDPKMRFGAAWCCGTAVENNPRGQEQASQPPPKNLFQPVADHV
jgi:hsp70-interacting protein